MKMAVLVLVLLTVRISSAADIPGAPAGVVADGAHLFSATDLARVEALGAQALRERGVSLRVLTLADAKGEDPKSIAVRALNQWRVGQQSVLLLVVMNPRALYIQPGSALAPAFDAGTCTRICETAVAPQMRLKAYGLAALGGLGAIRDQIARPAVPRPRLPPPIDPEVAARNRNTQEWVDFTTFRILPFGFFFVLLPWVIYEFRKNPGGSGSGIADSYTSSDSSFTSSSSDGGSSSDGSGGGGSDF